jgi:hypothetical protein
LTLSRRGIDRATKKMPVEGLPGASPGPPSFMLANLPDVSAVKMLNPVPGYVVRLFCPQKGIYETHYRWKTCITSCSMFQQSQEKVYVPEASAPEHRGPQVR